MRWPGGIISRTPPALVGDSLPGIWTVDEVMQRWRRIGLTNTANPAGSTTNADTHSFTSVSIGAAAGDRIILVSIVTYANSDLSSVVVDGGTASLITDGTTSAFANASNRKCYLYGILQAGMDNPSATSVTITLNWSAAIGTSRGVAISVYRMTGKTNLTANHVTIDQDSSNPLVVSVNTVARGAVIAGAVWQGTGGGSGGSNTWVGVSEETDRSIAASADGTTGSALTTSAESPRTITATSAGITTITASAFGVSFAPG